MHWSEHAAPLSVHWIWGLIKSFATSTSVYTSANRWKNRHKCSHNKDTSAAEPLASTGAATKHDNKTREERKKQWGGGEAGRQQWRRDEKVLKKIKSWKLKLWKSPSDLGKRSGHVPQCNRTGSPCCEEMASFWSPRGDCVELIVTPCCSVNKHEVIDEDKQSGWETCFLFLLRGRRRRLWVSLPW